MNGKPKEAAAFRARATRFPNWQEFDLPVVFGTDRRLNPDTSFGTAEGALIIGVATARALKSEVANRAGRIAQTMGRLDPATGRQSSEAAISIPHSQANLQGTGMIGKEAIWHLRHAHRYPGQVLIYVHGYNNSFEDAVRRAAMISFDLDFDGVAAVFSWPSKTSSTGYLGDRVQARKSAAKFAEFLEQMRAEVPDAKIHIVAHSTGAEVALSGLETLALEPKSWEKRLGEVIVAHGDIAAADLAQRARSVALLGSMITSYSSADDWAIWASSKLRFNQHRAGARPVSATGIQAIDITGLGGVFGANHAVFVSNPIVFSDITRLLRSGTRDPSQRTPTFIKLETPGGVTWVYRAQRIPHAQ